MADLARIKYRSSPIIEVVCEFRFVSDARWDAAVPDRIYDRIKGVFPEKRKAQVVESITGVAHEAGVEQKVTIIERQQFLREDETAFVQVSPNFLAINHLKPYPTWEKYLPLIRHAFEAYVGAAQPQGLHRIGLRYINRIEFEAKETYLEEHFKFRPQHPSMSEVTFEAFLVGLDVVYEEDRDRLRMQLASSPPESPGKLVAIFDLDYSLVQAEAVSLDEAIDWVDKTAHSRIQQAFEDCLTQDLKNRFEPEQE
jgi:uncharacterized protein (TIGR04255 family)